MKHGGLYLALSLALSVTGSLSAGEQADSMPALSLSAAPASGPAASPIPFSKDSWALQISGNYLRDLNAGGDVELAGGSIGVGYYFWDGMSLGVEGGGYHVNEPGVNATAGNLGLVLRQHVIRRERWSLYLDVGESLFEADHDVPRGGTHFNFLFHSGPGITWRLTDDVHLMAGVRYFHISNAQTQGADRNPGCNGIEGYVGVMLPF